MLKGLHLSSGTVKAFAASTTAKPIYYSSPWEKLWLDNIKTWQNNSICDALSQQQVRQCEE